MNTEFSIKKILLIILAQLFAIGTILAAYILGDLSVGFLNKTVGSVGYIASLAIIVMLLILNIILKHKLEAKLKQMKVAEANEFMLNQKANIKVSFDKATKKLYKTTLFCKLYIIFLGVLLHIPVFFAGVLNTSGGVGLVLFFYFFISNIYIHICMAFLSKPKLEVKEYLSRKEFPLLYSITDEAMNSVGVKGNVYICTDRSFDASITKIGNSYLINLGCSLVNCLLRDELYNILLHEFAHTSEQYTPKKTSEFFYRFMAFDGENIYSKATDSIFSYALAKYSFEYVFYTIAASEFIEAMADKVVIEKGNPKVFASALAKCNLHTSYERISFLYDSHPIFEAEAPQDNLATEYLNNFHLALKDNQEKWLESYEREIQPRNASHPIYRLRREAVGVKSSDVIIFFENNDKEYVSEAEKLLDFTNKMLVKNMTPHYEQSRKQYYLEPLSIVEAWERDKESYSVPELSPVIDALAELNRHREAEALCDKIIATEENIYKTAYARFFKGFMLLNYDDASGIDMLYQVIELNSNYFEGCLTYIGEFACRNGMQRELDEYRERAITLTQKNIDEDAHASTLSSKDKLVADTIDNDTLNKHIEFMVSCSDKIKSIYLVRKIITDTFYSRVFVVDFDKGTNVNEIGEAMDKIFRYLDLLDNEQYSLFFANDVYKSIVKKVDGSLVYNKK